MNNKVRMVLGLVALLGVVTLAQGAAANSSSFTVYPEAQADLYPRVERSSVYVTARDGTRLALDLYLPAPMRARDRLPTLVTSTRYWRRAQLSKIVGEQPLPFEESFYARRGYAVIHLDVRGTGASFGNRPGPWGPNEVQDGYDLVEWVVAQPWSDGTVGAFGTSYSGTSAALLGAVNHPAVKAVIPAFNEFDVYTDIAYPGGVFNEGFVREWAAANDVLDANRTPRKMFGLGGSLAVKGVAPVDGAEGKVLLEHAVREHATNADVFALAREGRSRDRKVDGRPSLDDFSLHQRSDDLGAAGTFVNAWGSWMDAGTAHAALTAFMTLDGPKRAVIGPWSHGGGNHASPFLPTETRTVGGGLPQMIEHLRVFDHLLKGTANGFEGENQILYYTMGEEIWRKTPTWPPAGLASKRLFFREEGSLDEERPPSRSDVSYEIDFAASTGTSNRWHTQLDGGDVIYADRRAADAKLLTFTSSPLETSLEITGHPSVSLRLASTSSANALHVYLEAVTEAGEVLYLTEGLLNTLHSAKTSKPPPYWTPGGDAAWRSFREADMAAVEPNREFAVSLSLLPTSVVVPKGASLRVAIAGADADTFERIPAQGDSTLTVGLGGSEGSFLDLPSQARPDLDHESPLTLDRYEGVYETPSGARIAVRAEEDFLYLTAGDSASLEVLRPGSKRFAHYDQKARELVTALNTSGRKALEEFGADPSLHGSLFERLKPLRKAKNPKVLGTENIGGMPVTVIDLGDSEEASFLLLWTDATEQLILAVPGSTLGQTRVLPGSATHFTALDLRGYDGVEFEVASDGKVTGLRLGDVVARRQL